MEMDMYRFYCEEGVSFDGSIVLTGSDVNHIKNVLRMKQGERLIACDGANIPVSSPNALVKNTQEIAPIIEALA